MFVGVGLLLGFSLNLEADSNMQRMYKYPIFVFLKKHHCPRCNTILERIVISKKVNSNSIEARHFSFDAADMHLYGDVLFIWDEFQCPKCGKHISVEDMVRIEKAKKKQRRQMKHGQNKKRHAWRIRGTTNYAMLHPVLV